MILRTRTAFLLCFCSLLGGSTARAQTSPGRQWLAPDFFVDSYGAAVWTRPAVPTPSADAVDCRAHIAQATCVLGDGFRAQGEVMSRRCLPDADKYIAFFEAVYDRFPAALQQMFCSVQTLRVEPRLESIAYAGMTGAGAVVGFRKSVIDEGLDLSTLLSWKEQLPFGGSRAGYKLKKNLPHETVSSSAEPIQDLAFYVLAHEFGHLFDFANDLNGACFPGANCKAQPGSWTALSWKTTVAPKPSFDFPYRADVCYYNCAGRPIKLTNVDALYEGLNNTGFVTLYAATNVYDDLAESLAFYMLDQTGDFAFTLDTRQGHTYDLLSKVHGESFKEKFDYLHQFLHRPDISYP